MTQGIVNCPYCEKPMVETKTQLYCMHCNGFDTEPNICEKCELYLVRFPACIAIDAELVHGEKKDYVTKCKNKAKNKHKKCGLCKKLELKTFLKPLGRYSWILREGRDININPEMLICHKCREMMIEKTKALRKVAKKLGIPVGYLKSIQTWLGEGREPTIEEFTKWARSQHKRACKEYTAAYPMSYYNGRCLHRILFNRPCASFFSHTGICETGYFIPERIKNLSWKAFNKEARKADRIVKKELKGG